MIQSNHSSKPKSVGLLRRLGALLYDALLLVAVLFFASLLIVVPFNITYGHPYYPIYVIYVYTISFFFLGWFWTHGGQTLGMRAWRIQLQHINGQSITWKWALYRFFSVLVFWFPAAAGYLFLQATYKQLIYFWIVPIVVDYLWCFLNPDRLAVHDILSRTRLVKIPSVTHQ